MPAFDVFQAEFSTCWNVLVSRDLSLRKQNLPQHPLRSAFEITALNETSSRKTISNLDVILESLATAHAGASMTEILPDFLEIDTVSYD